MEEKIHKIRIKSMVWSSIGGISYYLEPSLKTNYSTIIIPDEAFIELRNKIEDSKNEIKKIEQEKGFKEYKKRLENIKDKLSSYVKKIEKKYQKG